MAKKTAKCPSTAKDLYSYWILGSLSPTQCGNFHWKLRNNSFCTCTVKTWPKVLLNAYQSPKCAYLPGNQGHDCDITWHVTSTLNMWHHMTRLWHHMTRDINTQHVTSHDTTVTSHDMWHQHSTCDITWHDCDITWHVTSTLNMWHHMTRDINTQRVTSHDTTVTSHDTWHQHSTCDITWHDCDITWHVTSTLYVPRKSQARNLSEIIRCRGRWNRSTVSTIWSCGTYILHHHVKRLSVSSTLPAEGLDVSTSKVTFLLSTGTDFILGTKTKCQGKHLGKRLAYLQPTGGSEAAS